MITPTNGRVVWFYPGSYEFSALQAGGAMVRLSEQPFTAHVVHVWSDTCVNLVVFDHEGNKFARSSVPINIGDLGAGGSYADWMPYQRGQAAKTEAAEARVTAEVAATNTAVS